MTPISERRDGTALLLALLLHFGAFLYLYYAPPVPQKRITKVEVELRKPKPKPPEPEPVKPPEPPPPPPEPEPKKVVPTPPKPAQAPRPVEPPKTPPVEPPKPVFGVSPTQTGGDGISVPVGNTTMADPSKRPKVTEIPPLPATNAPPGSEYRPVGEEQLSKTPEPPDEDCGLGMKEKWSNSEAHANGIEGKVILRIELDERGKVRGIKVVKSLHPELDKIARGFMQFDPRCKFTPAIGKDGKPVPFVIEQYSVSFYNE